MSELFPVFMLGVSVGMGTMAIVFGCMLAYARYRRRPPSTGAQG